MTQQDYSLAPRDGKIGKQVKKGSKSPLILEYNQSLVVEIRLKNPTAPMSFIASEYERVTSQPIDQSTVSKYLLDARKQWAEKRLGDINEYIQEELTRLDVLEQEAWDAWRASIQSEFEEELVELMNPGDYKAAREMARQVSRAVQRELVRQGGGSVERDLIEDAVMQHIPDSTYQAVVGSNAELVTSRVTKMVRKRKSGDDKFLRLILDIQKERRKMIGVYSPERRDVSIMQVSVKGYSRHWSPDEWGGVVEGAVVEEAAAPPLLEEGGISPFATAIAQSAVSKAILD